MNSTLEVALLTWLSDTGTPANERWYWETSRHGNRVAHAVPTCSSVTGGLQELRATADEIAMDHSLCRDCLLGYLDPHADTEELKALTRLGFTHMSLDRWVDNADSTFHVIIGRTCPALHGAIVDDVQRHLRAELARTATHPALDPLRERLTARIDTLVAAHPYDAMAAMQEAILLSARWSVRGHYAEDLFQRRLKEHHNRVQELQTQFLDLVQGPGDARRVAGELRAANADLVQHVDLDAILDVWVTGIEFALMRTNPRFYACGGFALHLHSVPRGARDWVVRQGLRATHHHWGLGELPEIVLEFLVGTKQRNDKEASVTVLDPEHVNLAPEQWEIADALWREHQNMRREEVPYADPAQAILAATAL